MGTDITKPPTETAMLPTWKRLYEADWEQGFDTFMLILAQQYKMELMVQIGNQKQPSPVIDYWREGLKGLSPKQMLEGLRGWQRTERGGFQPSPENIRECGEGIEATDKPRRIIKPDCECCGGTGHRAADGRTYRQWNGTDKFKMLDCDCIRTVYRDQEFKAAPLQLPAPRTAAEENAESGDLIQRLAKKIPRMDEAVKPIPKVAAYMPSDAELERKKAEAVEAAKKFL